MEKYELTKNTFKTVFSSSLLHRVRATKDFTLADGTKISKGDLGGYVSSLRNLSQEGNCWLLNDAAAIDSSYVIGDAIVKDSAIIRDCGSAEGASIVEGHAIVGQHASVMDSAIVSDNALVAGFAVVKDIAVVKGSAKIIDNAIIRDSAVICGNALISDSALVQDNTQVSNNAFVGGNASIEDNAIVSSGTISDFAVICGNVNISSEDVVVEGKSVVTGNAILNKKALINTDNTIGVNAFNYNEYSFTVSADICTKITDENFLQHSLIPVSGKCCMFFRPSGAVNLFLPNLSERFPFVPYSAFFIGEKELWETLLKKLPLSDSSLGVLSEEEFMFYNYFLSKGYEGIDADISKIGASFLTPILTCSILGDKARIKEKLPYIISMCQKYLFAYLVSFLLRFFEKIYKMDEYICSNKPVENLLDCCSINLKDRSIVSFGYFGEGMFNSELIRMIRNTCNLSKEWEDNILLSLSSKSPSLLKPLIL